MDINEIISSLSQEDISQLKSVADSIFGGESKNKDINTGGSDVAESIANLNKLFGADDDRTALIKALKPMLSEPKQQKADEAIKLLRLMQLIPLLRDSGFLKGLL